MNWGKLERQRENVVLADGGGGENCEHSSWAMVKDDIQLLFIWHEILSRQTTVIRQVLLRVLFMEK